MIISGYNIPDMLFVWCGFFIFIILMLVLDLGFFQKKDHRITVKEALAWTAFWISISLAFDVIIFFWQGRTTALEFLTGYILEKSLSVDNLFVFLLILTYFSVSPKYWHKVLFYGILGALLLRGLFIGVGIAVISTVHWVIYIFGIILIYTAIRVAIKGDEKIEPEKNPVIRFFRKFVPVTKDYKDGKFYTRIDGKLFLTPLFIVLISIETTDILFATDSIPAVFGVTLNPFIVYTSNIFAILGLRALFFAISGVMEGLYYLNYGLSVVLGFIGVKILLGIEQLPFHYNIPVLWTLLFVGIVLSIAIVASYVHTKRQPHDINRKKTDNETEPIDEKTDTTASIQLVEQNNKPPNN